MMTAAFTINNGPLLDVEAYGVELLTYSQSNQAEGQMQVTVIRRPDEPFLFKLNDSVTIYINGVRYFTGLADQGTMLASSTDYRHAHILRDPWTVLENCQWRWENLTDDLPSHIANSASLWYLLQRWQARTLSRYFTMPIWPSTVPQLHYGAWNNVIGPLAANVTRLLKPNILVAQSWDHSTVPPTMVIRNQGDLVLNLEKEEHGVGDDIVLTRRDDLKPVSVELAFRDQDWENTEHISYTQLPIILAFNEPNAIHPTGAIHGGYGSVIVLNDFSISLEQVQDGLAEFVFDLLSIPVWEGTFTVQTYLDAADGGTPLRLAPGMTVNLSGPGYCPDWATMNAVIQAVELDMKSGKATVHVGANGHASLTDMMERARDVLGMRFYEGLYATAPQKGLVEFTAGEALGPLAAVTVSGNIFSGSLTVSASTPATDGPYPGTLFVDITLPKGFGPNFQIIPTLGSNAEAKALNAVFTCISPTQLRISKRTIGAAANKVYEWDLILQKR